MEPVQEKAVYRRAFSAKSKVAGLAVFVSSKLKFWKSLYMKHTG
jgi:hypothetical protein